MRLTIQFRISYIIWILLIITFSLNAQVPFSRGVNLTGWFQSNSAHEIQFSRFTKKDFERIKSLGCDAIRLPINLHAMTNGEPDYTLDPLFLYFLDQAATWAEELQIHLLLDNHSFDPAQNTSPDIGPTLVKVWTQMAEHYESRSEYLYYEVLNEPHGIADATWGGIQQTVIDAIRTKDTKHYIIIGPAGWNSYNNLKELPVYTDSKLVYTFHFYDPFIFTHQGAGWTNPSLVPLGGVPFPYSAGNMPATPNSLQGTWIESAINNYPYDGNINKVKSLIDIAVNFKNQRNVPVFCGEFGVYIPNSNNADRVLWYETVRGYFEEKNIPWTIWDYTGGFGIFEKGTNELFNYDLNVPLLNALGMTAPPQETYKKRPQTNGFMIYDDFIGEGIFNSSYRGNGELDFYSVSSPKAGDYCIYWTGSDQYNNIGFDFKPDLDLSLLKDNDHVVKLWVRGNSELAKFDIRFVDTKTGANDHPWRMGKTIEQIITADQTWHEVTVLLKDLREKGSWDNAWFNPEGKFDWTAIDRFEIVAEHHDMKGIEFSFDDIMVFGDEVPYEEPVTAVIPENPRVNFNIFPNPVINSSTIYFSLSKVGSVRLAVYTITGQALGETQMSNLQMGNHTLLWEELMKNEGLFPPGFYLVKLETQDQTMIKRVVKTSQ